MNVIKAYEEIHYRTNMGFGAKGPPTSTLIAKSTQLAYLAMIAMHTNLPFGLILASLSCMWGHGRILRS